MAEQASVEARQWDMVPIALGASGVWLAFSSWALCAHLSARGLESSGSPMAQLREDFVIFLLAGAALSMVNYLVRPGRAWFLLPFGVGEAFLAGSLHWWGRWPLAAPCAVATVSTYGAILLSARSVWPAGWQRACLVAPSRETVWTDLLVVSLCALLVAGRIVFASPQTRALKGGGGEVAAGFLLTFGSLLAIGTWVWLALDLWRRRKALSDMAFMGWFMAFLGLSIVGAMAYYLFVKRPEMAAEGRGAG